MSTQIQIDSSAVAAAVSTAIVNAIDGMKFHELQTAIKAEVAKLVADKDFVDGIMTAAKMSLDDSRGAIAEMASKELVIAHTAAIRAQIRSLAVDVVAVRYVDDYTMRDARQKAAMELALTDEQRAAAWARENGWIPASEASPADTDAADMPDTNTPF